MRTNKVITLNPELIELRLGGVIKKCLTSEEIKQMCSAQISIANDTWYGKFDIPESIGFSTPVSLLQGGRLILILDPEYIDSPFYDTFWRWSCTHSGEGVRCVTDQVISVDKLTCAICSVAYVVDDVIQQLNSCGHMFHKKCIGQVIVRNCELCQLMKMESFEFHKAHTSCNLSVTPVSCPICQLKTNV